MKINKIDIISIILILGVFFTSFYFYNILPDIIITHWDFKGIANGWSSTYSYLIYMNIFIILIYLLFKYLPKIDPKKENYKKFNKIYNIFRLIFILFLILINIITILVNLGINLSINIIVPVLVSILFIILGVYMPKIKRNWFIGIRTPWTLSNDIVWKNTHIFAGKVFIIAGLLFILTIFISKLFYFIIILLLSPIIYSYLEFRKIK